MKYIASYYEWDGLKYIRISKYLWDLIFYINIKTQLMDTAVLNE